MTIDNIPSHINLYTNLQNRPRIIIIKIPTLTTSVVSLWFQAGYRYAPLDMDGLPHLFEHLFLAHNQQYPNKFEFLADMEKRGYIYNANTSASLTSYYILCSPDQTTDALAKLIQSYQTSIISHQDLAHEKEVVLHEARLNQSNIFLYSRRIANQGIWPKTSLSRDIFGSKETLSKITYQDVNIFRKKYYQKDNMSIIILTPSNLNSNEIMNLISLSPSKPKPTFKFQKESYPKPKNEIKKEHNLNNVHILMSYRFGKISDRENSLMNFLSYILANNWTSYLVNLLRLEENLTYWVSGNVFRTYDTGCLQLYFTTYPKHYQRAIELVKDKVNKLKNCEFTQNDLSKFKQLFLIKNLLKINNPYAMLTYYGHYALVQTQKPTLFQTHINHILNSTTEEIQYLLRRYFSDQNLSISLIGNYET